MEAVAPVAAVATVALSVRADLAAGTNTLCTSSAHHRLDATLTGALGKNMHQRIGLAAAAPFGGADEQVRQCRVLVAISRARSVGDDAVTETAHDGIIFEPLPPCRCVRSSGLRRRCCRFTEVAAGFFEARRWPGDRLVRDIGGFADHGTDIAWRCFAPRWLAPPPLHAAAIERIVDGRFREGRELLCRDAARRAQEPAKDKKRNCSLAGAHVAWSSPWCWWSTHKNATDRTAALPTTAALRWRCPGRRSDRLRIHPAGRTGQDLRQILPGAEGRSRAGRHRTGPADPPQLDEVA